MTWEEAVDRLDSWDGNGVAWDTYPAADDFETVLREVWMEARCPPPPPEPLEVDPGWAIPGMRAFLEILGPNPATVVCLGVPITATARYVVRWGDGTEVPTTSRGGPWPHGDVTHVYATAGQVVIVVEAYWTGGWAGGDLPELPVPTTAELPLPVHQVQAVRDR